MSSLSERQYWSWVQSDLRMQLDPRLEVFDAGSDDGQIERGIKVNDDVPPNTTLAIVPFDSLLSVAVPIEDEGFAALRDRLSEDDMLSLLLLHEQHKGPRSRWSNHFAFIPRTYHSVANYADEDLALLRGSNLFDVAYRWKEQLRADFAALTAILRDCSFRFDAILGGQLQFEQYLWALSTIWSRCITVAARGGRDYRCVVPFVDLLNHCPTSQVGHAYNAQNDSLYLVTGQRIARGGEVSLHYGPCANSRLLMLYGFTLSNNPYDAVDLFASVPDDSDDRTALIKTLQLPHNGQPFRLPVADDETDGEAQLLLFLRILHADLDQIKQLKTVASTLPLARVLQVTLSPANEMAAVGAAIAAVKGMLDAYPTTLAQDLLKLRELGAVGGFVHPRQHAVHALYLVLGEKKVLHKVLKRLEQKLRAVDAP